MKILILAALYPTNSAGGAEDCAQSFAAWAAGAGHDIAVVTAAEPGVAAPNETRDGAIRLFRIPPPHVLPITTVRQGPKWLKPLWHMQDHLSLSAAADIDRVLDAVRPDIVMIHYLQGFGYRLLPRIAARGVPIAYVLHDLGLACYRMSLFKNGANCAGQCAPCVASSRFKRRLLHRADRAAAVGLISPSQANLDTLARYFPVGDFANAAILNTKAYPAPTVLRTESETLRLLFAGKIEHAKGIDILIEAVERVIGSSARPIRLTVAGRGSLEQELRARYADAPWCRFIGFVDQQALANEMIDADVLCVPSIWQENSPGVVVQALLTELPVIATDRGGVRELVRDEETGLLIGGTRDDWVAALRRVLHDGALLPRMRGAVRRDEARFDQDAIGRRTIDFMQRIVAAAQPERRA